MIADPYEVNPGFVFTLGFTDSSADAANLYFTTAWQTVFRSGQP